MKKFLVLYRSPVSASEMMVNATPEQAKAGMDAWMAWAKRAGEGIVDLGTPLGDGKSVASGSVSASKSQVTGFSILQAESEDAVIALLRDHPHLGTPGDSSIEVHEFLALPGM